MAKRQGTYVAVVALLVAQLWAAGAPQTAIANDQIVSPAAAISGSQASSGLNTLRSDRDYSIPGTRKSTYSPFLLSRPEPVPPFPILLNAAVQRCMHDYLAQPAGLEEGFDRSRPYLVQMIRVMRANGVPDDLVYLAFAESAFSERGKGPWQFTKATAIHYGLHVNSYVDERRDPILSTKAAAEYLARLHDEAGSDWRVALVGWNGGSLAIDRYWVLRGSNFDKYSKLLPLRTRMLLARFMAVTFIAHNAVAYGIDAVNFDEPPQYRIVRAPRGTALSTLAVRHHTTVAKLKSLNPALLKDRVPPDVRSYPVRIPLVRGLRAHS
jgi:peptidoglycan lytic transglycosylase D